MKLPIYLYGSTVLRTPTQEITPQYPEFEKLIQNMFETLKYADGVGLAAPQVGLPIRVFIVDGSDLAEDYPELKDFKRVFVNPRVLEESAETCIFSEGCLSVPKIHTDVERPCSVKMAYLNERFEPMEEWFHGFGCRMVQHEYAHLEGELFIDLIPPIRKKMLESKLTAIAKGKGHFDYKTKLVK